MQSFTDSISALSHLKRIFGLNVSPIRSRKKVSSLKKEPRRVYQKFSIPWSVYALLLHTVHMTMFARNLSFTMNYKVSILDFGLDMMFTIMGALGMLITVIWSLKNTCRLKKMKSSLESFDHKFKMFGKTVNNKLTRNFVAVEFLAVFLFWAFYFAYYVFWNCENGTIKCFKNWFVTYHPHKVVLVAFMEEIALLYGLTVRFRCLNDLLLGMEMDTMIDVSHTYLPFQVHPKKSVSVAKSSSCSKMAHCRELHYFLCELSSNLNDMFSLQTVANILDCFVNIFVMLYLACFGYSRDVETSTADYNPLGILLPLTVGGEAFTKIYYLAKHCDSVQFEVS